MRFVDSARNANITAQYSTKQYGNVPVYYNTLQYNAVQ